MYTFKAPRWILEYFNFHPLEVVNRCRDPQLQVGENVLPIQNTSIFKKPSVPFWIFNRPINNATLQIPSEQYKSTQYLTNVGPTS